MTNFKFKDQNDFWAKLTGVIAFLPILFQIDPYTTAPQNLINIDLKKKKKKKKLNLNHYI